MAANLGLSAGVSMATTPLALPAAPTSTFTGFRSPEIGVVHLDQTNQLVPDLVPDWESPELLPTQEVGTYLMVVGSEGPEVEE